jgi:hypothetical protein
MWAYKEHGQRIRDGACLILKGLGCDMVLWGGSRGTWTEFLNVGNPYNPIFKKLVNMCLLEGCEIHEDHLGEPDSCSKVEVQNFMLRMVDRLLRRVHDMRGGPSLTHITQSIQDVSYLFMYAL